MGERIRDIGILNFQETNVQIELNKSYSKRDRYDIHLQTEKAQISFVAGDFIKLAAALRKGLCELERNKLSCQTQP